VDLIIDALVLVVFGLVTWCVAGEGSWGAVVVFLCTFLSGVLAMNFFEPLAALIEGALPSDYRAVADIIALMGLFTAFVFLTRIATEQFQPTYVAIFDWLHEPLRWLFGAATGYLMVAIVLIAVHVAPLPRDCFGFRAERANFLGIVATDRQWLGLVQWMSEKSLSGGSGGYFDGTLVKFPNPEMKAEILSSFPIRYAQRRQRLFPRGFESAATTAPPSPASTPSTTPNPNTGASVPANPATPSTGFTPPPFTNQGKDSSDF
jgi:hypothetical protein